MIQPAEMAQIYWTRLRVRSIFAVDRLLHDYAKSPGTRAYWLAVKSILSRNVGKHSGPRGKA